MAKLDIRKYATPTTVHYEALRSGGLYATDIARLRELTAEGRAFLAKAPEFCRLERMLIARLLSGHEISKAALMVQFGLPSRVFNAAYGAAKGLVDSAKACAERALEGTREALSRALIQYAEAEADPSRHGELHGRRRRITRLVEQEARHEQLVLRPRIFPGGEFYRQQHRQPGCDWKQAFQARRANHISANGGADEQRGNKTLQVTLGPAEPINGRLWQWFDLKHARKPFGRFRLWASECAGLVAAVQANTAAVKTAPVEVWFDVNGKKIGPQRQAQMVAAGAAPASIRQIERAVTASRVCLTIDLRRQETGRWYIHISRKQSQLPAPFAPAGWIGVDLNCDSIAHSAVSVREGQPVLGSYAKEAFPAGSPAGERLTVLHRIIGQIVADAAARRYGISLEYLDFEHCKRWLRTKLGAMLHLMPYRKIRGIFERRCLEAGVPLRYVPPKYSSLLGALLSAKWPILGRDQAAGAVLALRASEAGNPWLERACEQAVKAERLSLRLNAKGRFGHTLVAVDLPPPPESNGTSGRQSDSPRFPVEPALQWQVACGRKISRAFSTLADLRSASLRDQRRAAKALKRSPVRLPRFEMPSLIELKPTKPHRLASCSTLIKVA